jgi:hypothetical protein
VDLALISFFSALWAVLNLTVAPIGFHLFGLPIVHGVISFLTLILIVWATGKFGASSLVGVIGSSIVLLAGGPLPVVGFAIAAFFFDLILAVSRHKIALKPASLTAVTFAVVFCAYLAGVVNGVFILSQPFQFAVTVWGGWTALGGAFGLVVALPIVAVLERANVKKVKND